MSEFIRDALTVVLFAASFLMIVAVLSLSSASGYSRKPSKTDPFAGRRHFHIVTRPTDLRPEDCPEWPECEQRKGDEV